MLTKEQIKEIKSQLLQHIENTFPKDKKQSAKEQIEGMDEGQLEEFLKQNNLIKKEGETSNLEQKNPFRGIVNGQIPSYKIDENSDTIAVLEINPISKGHTILIPKQEINSIEKMPQSIFSLSKKISKRIKSKLKPKEVKISSSNIFGEFIINVFPVYENESLDSKRYHATKEELQEIQKKLEKKPRKKIIKKKSIKIKEKKIRFPRRIP